MNIYSSARIGINNITNLSLQIATFLRKKIHRWRPRSLAIRTQEKEAQCSTVAHLQSGALTDDGKVNLHSAASPEYCSAAQRPTPICSQERENLSSAYARAEQLQRSAKVFVRGCEKFVPALAYLSCLPLPGS